MLPKVLSQVGEFPLISHDILLIDNSSADSSLDVASRYIRDHANLSNIRIFTICNERNLGYGGSICRGFEFAQVEGYEWVWIIHSDDQTNWFQVLDEIEKIKKNNLELDVILGSRFLENNLTANYSLARRAGNSFFTFATSLLTGVRLSDPGAAIGAYRTSVIKGIPLRELDQGYRFHPELNLIFASRKVHLSSFAMSWQDATDSDGLRIFRYGSKLLMFLIKVWFYKKIKRYNLEDAVIA
jgi:glycosyltransferase involved in cell wall biosynthesis